MRRGARTATSAPDDLGQRFDEQSDPSLRCACRVDNKGIFERHSRGCVRSRSDNPHAMPPVGIRRPGRRVHDHGICRPVSQPTANASEHGSYFGRRVEVNPRSIWSTWGWGPQARSTTQASRRAILMAWVP